MADLAAVGALLQDMDDLHRGALPWLLRRVDEGRESMTDSIQNDVQAIHTVRERTMQAANTAGGASVPEKGKFFWLYSRGSDGPWKMSRVIWNASEPSPSQ